MQLKIEIWKCTVDGRELVVHLLVVASSCSSKLNVSVMCQKYHKIAGMSGTSD